RLDELIAKMTHVPPTVGASRAVCAGEGARIEHPGDDRLWTDAQRQWDALGNRFDAAYARWRRAEAMLSGTGDRAEAQTLLREAHDVARELGAEPLRGEIERLARRGRLELGGDDAPEALAESLQQLELTPREVEVLALLADGMTNREIATELFISS